jgi:hypothetical protein
MTKFSFCRSHLAGTTSATIVSRCPRNSQLSPGSAPSPTPPQAMRAGAVRHSTEYLVRLAIWLVLFAMLRPCRRVVLVRFAGLFGLIVPIGHVINPRLTYARKLGLCGHRRAALGPARQARHERSIGLRRSCEPAPRPHSLRRASGCCERWYVPVTPPTKCASAPSMVS